MLESVKVDKGKLMSTLQENRGKHVAEYTTAVEQYRVEAEKALRKRALAIRDGETLKTGIDLPEPKSFEADYDRAIAMVDWSTESVIELDEQDFRAFVLDEWNWRGQFAGTTSIYNNR
jgi:NOL1/NOP2/fmu family ribosome biogenesis protein